MPLEVFENLLRKILQTINYTQLFITDFIELKEGGFFLFDFFKFNLYKWLMAINRYRLIGYLTWQKRFCVVCTIFRWPF